MYFPIHSDLNDHNISKDHPQLKGSAVSGKKVKVETNRVGNKNTLISEQYQSPPIEG